MNVNIVNPVEAGFVPSIYTKGIYHEVKKRYESKEELKQLLDYCTTFEQRICMTTDLKLLNYLNFSEYYSFLSQPNDVMDAETVIAGLSPYDFWKAKPASRPYSYEPQKGDIFMESIPEKDIERRKQNSCLPVELSDQDIQSNVEDPIALLPTQTVNKFMQLIETYFVVEYEKLDLLLDLALVHWSAFDSMSNLIIKAGFAKDDNAITVYKAVANVLCLPQIIKEWKRESIKLISHKTNTRELPFDNGTLSVIFPIMNKTVNEELLESIVYLAHGVITQGTLKEIANKFFLDNKLIQCFFLTSRPSELR